MNKIKSDVDRQAKALRAGRQARAVQDRARRLALNKAGVKARDRVRRLLAKTIRTSKTPAQVDREEERG